MYTSKERIILASASPRRKDLLASCGLAAEVMAPQCDEGVRDGEGAQDLVKRLALLKAAQIAARYADAWVIGADTVVLIDGEVLGKPGCDQEASRMLSKLLGRTHEVWGGFALVHAATGRECVECRMSRVTMVPARMDVIKSYIATGEPRDKAGAYAAQGIGASLISSIEGSYTNVVGLDLAALIKAMNGLGIISCR